MLVDLSQVPHEVRVKIHEIFTRDFDLKALRAVEEQKRMAKFWHGHRPRSSDGVGEQRMALHPFIDATWRAARGANCWADRDFREWYMKKNPEVRVRSVGTKIQSGYRGEPSRVLQVRGGGKRYTKSYGP